MQDKIHFPLADAAREPTTEGRLSAAIWSRGQVDLRYYRPVGVDQQTPHDRDELYFVATGSGTFVCGDARTDFVSGDLLFAPAGAEHRFEDFSDDFAVWVMFYGPTGGEQPAPE
ncbi:MAG: cupin domain-containing protein [Alphaproteobacteria bacterium]|jgi:mannose-6-phosphate isomerase-like protein (cupin superfamily)|nr:cupin domain-containing protein [Alphaproteobacteria bacterium]